MVCNNPKSTHGYLVNAGFTLVELVLVIMLSGIVAAIVVPLVTKPVTGYIDVSRRTTLVDAAESAIRRMQRDVRHALPNSIRITGGNTLEILYAVDGGRYRFGPDSTNPGADPLDFTGADTSFDVIGSLQNFADISPGSDWVVVYNLTATGADHNAYIVDGIEDNRVLLSAATASNLVFAAGIQFPLSSPQQRFYIINGAVTYQCAGSDLLRYSGYGISQTQPPPLVPPPALIAQNISTCSFVYNPGTAHRSGLLTISLEISDAGETITLLHQVHVDNTS